MAQISFITVLKWFFIEKSHNDLIKKSCPKICVRVCQYHGSILHTFFISHVVKNLKIFCAKYLQMAVLSTLRLQGQSYVSTNRVGGSKFFMGGLIVYSGKLFFQKLQNLLNKSPKDGGAIAPLAPQFRPPCLHLCWLVSQKEHTRIF